MYLIKNWMERANNKSFSIIICQDNLGCCLDIELLMFIKDPIQLFFWFSLKNVLSIVYNTLWNVKHVLNAF